MHTQRFAPFAIWRLLALLCLGILLAACEPAGDEPGSCAAEDLVHPDLISPAHNSVIDDLSPTFQWTYPDYSCLPEDFRLLLATSGSYYDSGPILAETVVSGTASSWDPGVTLAPGDIYFWEVQARVDSDGPWRQVTFYTGPLCSDTGDAIQPPVLESPANGETLTGLRAHLRWDDPTPCRSGSHYWIEVSESPGFADSVVLWTSIFEDFVLPHEADNPEQSIELEPCTTYYWRVQSGLAIPPTGPYSETWSFNTPSESGAICGLVPLITPLIMDPGAGLPPAGHAAIAGHVWHDLCATPHGSVDAPPPGCVRLPDMGLTANGIYDPGEPGIEGVTVRLVPGVCPGAGAALLSTTDAAGQFSFHDLAGGDYCIKIDALEDGNVPVLLPGTWTAPYRWSDPGPITIDVALLGDDDISRLNDFGWDYQFFPTPAEVTPGPAPMLRAIQTANCRFGPSAQFDPSAILNAGDELPILGRNFDSTWWLVRPPGEPVDCWVWGNAVETSGDLSLVLAMAGPPTPTPFGCWQRQGIQYPWQCVVPCPPEEQNPSYCVP